MRKAKIYSVLVMGVIFLVCSCEKVTLEKPQVEGDVSFSQEIVPIFTKSCIGCHNGGLNPDLRADKAYDALTNGGYYNTQSPADSKLYKQLTTKSSHISKTSDLEKATILQWITNGAPNN